jgi:hypothetical protein
MLWASQIMLYAGYTARRRDPPTIYIVNTQIWLGIEWKPSILQD